MQGELVLEVGWVQRGPGCRGGVGAEGSRVGGGVGAEGARVGSGVGAEGARVGGGGCRVNWC